MSWVLPISTSRQPGSCDTLSSAFGKIAADANISRPMYSLENVVYSGHPGRLEKLDVIDLLHSRLVSVHSSCTQVSFH
eukprot:14627056-Ditylum_brightwellii.AAC.1